MVQRGSHGARAGGSGPAGWPGVGLGLPAPERRGHRGAARTLPPAWDQEPWGGVHARGAGWLRGRGAGPTPGLPLSQEPAAAAPTGHGVISKVSHADAPPAGFRAGPRPLVLVPTHALFSGSWSRAPRHVQPSGLGWITCSRCDLSLPLRLPPQMSIQEPSRPIWAAALGWGHPRSPSCLGPVTAGHTPQPCHC